MIAGIKYIAPSIIKEIKDKYTNKEIRYRSLNIKDFYKIKELEDLQELINTLIADTSIEEVRKRTLLDIKIGFYKKGEYTCYINDWHLDGGLNNKSNPNNYRENIYHIFCINAPTEFLDKEASKYINKIYYPNMISYKNIEIIKEGQWYKYGEGDYHRGPLIQQDCHRIWLRATYTDYIKAINYKIN
jgi:hypothetical protein